MTPQVHRIEVERGQELAIDWYPAPTGASVALYIHGLASHRRGEKARHFAQRFNEHGWAFAALDLRGHGESGGTLAGLTMSRMLHDLSCAIDWLRRRTSGNGLVLIGASLGAAVVAWHVVTRQDHRAPLVVMIAPSLRFPASLASALSADELDRWRHTGLRRFVSRWIDVEIGFDVVVDGEQYPPDQLERRYVAPTLILHGMRDDSMDWTASAAFAQCAPATVDLFLLGDGDHRLTDERELLFDLMWYWINGRRARCRPLTMRG